MSVDLDFADLDARIDARLAALTRRAGSGMSFASDPDDPGDDLAQLLDLARTPGGDATGVLHFAADGDDGGSLARARRECAAFFRDVWRELSSLAVVRTGEVAYSRVGWTGDATTALARDIAPAEAAAHAAAVDTALRSCLHRLRLLTTIAAAASRIAALIATPGAGVMALPVAYRCVRDVYDEEQGRTPWPTMK